MTAPSEISSPAALKPVGLRPRFSAFRAIGALILREMNTSYGRSPAGYLWAIIQPLGGIALMVLIFSAGFRSPPLGSSFALFYATGFMPFFFFLEVSTKISQALNYSKPLLVYPRITIVDAIAARFILNALTQILVSFILISGVLLLYETRTTLVLERVFLSYAMAAAFGVGVGIMNCFLIGIMPSWQQIWSIVTRPLIFISGIIFLFGSIPEPYQSYIWFNPLIHIVGEMRAAFYVSYDAEYVSESYVFGLSLFLMTLGMLFLRRYHKDILTN